MGRKGIRSGEHKWTKRRSASTRSPQPRLPIDGSSQTRVRGGGEVLGLLRDSIVTARARASISSPSSARVCGGSPYKATVPILVVLDQRRSTQRELVQLRLLAAAGSLPLVHQKHRLVIKRKALRAVTRGSDIRVGLTSSSHFLFSDYPFLERQ